jgi:hypothetical protein
MSSFRRRDSAKQQKRKSSSSDKYDRENKLHTEHFVKKMGKRDRFDKYNEKYRKYDDEEDFYS